MDRRPPRESPVNADRFAAGVILEGMLGRNRVAARVTSYGGSGSQSKSNLPVFLERGDRSQPQPRSNPGPRYKVLVRGINSIVAHPQITEQLQASHPIGNFEPGRYLF